MLSAKDNRSSVGTSAGVGRNGASALELQQYSVLRIHHPRCRTTAMLMLYRRLLRVSKEWKRRLESTPSLWRHLDLSQAKSRVSFRALKGCVIRSRGSMTHATMFRWDAGQHDALAYTTSRCKRLEYLNLRDGFGNVALTSAIVPVPNLKTLIISPERGVTLKEVTELLAKLPHLEHAEFLKLWTSGTTPQWDGDFPNLRVLKLHAAQDSRNTIPLRLCLVCSSS